MNTRDDIFHKKINTFLGFLPILTNLIGLITAIISVSNFVKIVKDKMSENFIARIKN